jgi:GMP synthase C terminal domain
MALYSICLQVDEIYIEFIREHGLYDKIWQAFAVFLDVRSVGVQVTTNQWQTTSACLILAQKGLLRLARCIAAADVDVWSHGAFTGEWLWTLTAWTHATGRPADALARGRAAGSDVVRRHDGRLVGFVAARGSVAMVQRHHVLTASLPLT